MMKCLNCFGTRSGVGKWSQNGGNSNELPHIALLIRTIHYDNYYHSEVGCMAEYLNNCIFFNNYHQKTSNAIPEGMICKERGCIRLRDRWKKRRDGVVEELIGMNKAVLEATVRHMLLHSHFERMGFL